MPLETLRLTYYINFTQHSTSEADISSVRQEVHSILWHPTFRYRVHKVQPPVLAPATFIQSTVSHQTSLRYTLTLTSRLRQRLPKLFISCTFSYQNTARTSLPPTSHMPDHPTQHFASNTNHEAAHFAIVSDFLKFPPPQAQISPSTPSCLTLPSLCYSLYCYVYISRTPQQFNAADKNAHL